jgi:hypothetical protein
MRVGRYAVVLGIVLALAVVWPGARVWAFPPLFDASVVSPKTVGWASYRQLNRLPELTSGVAVAQFASTDPTGQNRDYWDGPQHCLSVVVIGQCVIAAQAGAGEIDGIWFTWHGGDVRSVGDISIVLDGRLVVHAPLQDVVNGTLGAPFSYPLVGNANQSSGGVYISVPMPFRFGMLVTTDSSSFYYHVTYRTFADAAGVDTFNPFDRASDVLDTMRAAGTRDPKPPMPGAHTVGSAVNLAPGGTAELADVHGPGTLTAIRLRLPQTRSVAPSEVTAGGRAFGRGGSSTFTMRIDPHNNGIRLTRRFDPEVTRQVAEVAVDGTVTGRWAPNEPPASAPGVQSVRPSSAVRSSDESIDIPAALTRGKSAVTITNRFVSSDLDFDEFTYWVDDTIDGSVRRTDTLQIADAASESAHGYRIVGQTWQGERTFAYPLDSRDLSALLTTRKLLDGLRLRISFDGEATVDAPLGEFFGTAFALVPVRSLMFGIDPDSHTFSAWWPMPYASHAVVQLYNGSAIPVTGAHAEITAAPDPATAGALAAGRIGHFYASSHAGPTQPGRDWEYLRAKGTGKFVGNVAAMTGPANRSYLEGNERIYADGAPTPEINGTGTEDYYEGGWYFNRGTFNTPLHGNTVHLTAVDGCPADSDCTSAYRLWLADAVPFHSSLRVGIQHGGTNDTQATYSSTAFWYGRGSVDW